jgi:hypothetical protein
VPDHALQAETTDSNAVNEEARADEPESMPDEEEDEEEDEIEEDTHTVVTTRSGRASKMPSYLLDHFETALVGAGIGGGFVSTSELHTIKFDEAMASPEQSLWARAVEEEFENMKEHEVFDPVKKVDIPAGSKVLSTTWVMKKKANGRYKERITARGYEQRDGEHFNSSDKASPVVNEITIRIVFTLIVMVGWWNEIVDVKGAFLTAEFEKNQKMYVTVPRGFEKNYPENVVLLLKRTLYGTCQAAIQIWKKLCNVMTLIKAQRSKADVCLFFQWTATGLLLYLSWVDDILITGTKQDVLEAKKAFSQHFTLDEQGEMLEYVGCKIEHNREEEWMKMTQPVMIQSFADEFELPDEAPHLPAPPGEILTRSNGEPLGPDQSSKYRSGTGKIMHMMKWSRNEILNRGREISRFMATPTSMHLKRLYRLMNYVIQNCGSW